jgi:N4-gp56 family major capsid protein
VPNTFGFGTDTTGFSSTVHDHILKEVVATLRAGLVSMPKGAIVPAVIISQQGENFTLRSTAYPDLVDTTPTDPLTEGVAPNPLKLGIDTLDWTVTQSGGRTVITDIAQMQSPHDLRNIAADKIARLAAEKVDAIGRAALAAGAADLGDAMGPLDTDILLDVVSNLQNRDVEPVPGIGFYCLLHPYALRGLTGESDLNGYVDVTAHADAGNLTKGAVGQYRGVTFLTSTKFAATAGSYPVYMFGANAIAAGDVSTLEFIHWSAAGVGNELQQLAGVGFKGILGAKVLDFAESADGSGTNGSTVARAVQFTVQSGVSGILG